ncbi:MAG: EamA family transporter [Anaerolineae bacterium]
MLALLVATFFSSAFGLVLRDAMGRRCNPWAVGVMNYVTATAIQLARHAATGDPWRIESLTLLLGSAVGVLYALNFSLFVPLLSRRGVSIPAAMSRLAVILPMLASLLIWGERLTGIQGAGALLSLAALPLLTLTRGEHTTGGKLDVRTAGLLLALLTGNGLSMVLTKAYERSGLNQQALFLASLFGTAILVSGIAWWRQRQGTSPRDVVPGMALGLTNALANWGLVAALVTIPAVLVFPFYSAAGLVITAILARMLFGERISRLEATGIATAVAAVTLANLG